MEIKEAPDGMNGIYSRVTATVVNGKNWWKEREGTAEIYWLLADDKRSKVDGKTNAAKKLNGVNKEKVWVFVAKGQTWYLDIDILRLPPSDKTWFLLGDNGGKKQKIVMVCDDTMYPTLKPSVTPTLKPTLRPTI